MTYPQAIQYVLDGGKARRSDWPEDWVLEGAEMPLINGRHFNPDQADYHADWEKAEQYSIYEAIKHVVNGGEAKRVGKDWRMIENGYGVMQCDDNGNWHPKFTVEDVTAKDWILL